MITETQLNNMKLTKFNLVLLHLLANARKPKQKEKKNKWANNIYHYRNVVTACCRWQWTKPMRWKKSNRRKLSLKDGFFPYFFSHFRQNKKKCIDHSHSKLKSSNAHHAIRWCTQLLYAHEWVTLVFHFSVSGFAASKQK